MNTRRQDWKQSVWRTDFRPTAVLVYPFIVGIISVAVSHLPVEIYAEQPVILSFEEFDETGSVSAPLTTPRPVQWPSLKRTAISRKLEDMPAAPSPAPLPAFSPGSSANESDATARLFHTTIPASQMTIRRDPQKNRFLGNDAVTAKSIQSVQQELQSKEQSLSLINAPPIELTYSDGSADDPYGRYIYIPHEPLFFEDIPLERYGEECFHPYLQPFVSFGKFMGTIPVLPYKITTDYYAAFHENANCAYDHHHNLRPGILEGSFLLSPDAIRKHPRANLAGALVEGGTVAGIFFILP